MFVYTCLLLVTNRRYLPQPIQLRGYRLAVLVLRDPAARRDHGDRRRRPVQHPLLRGGQDGGGDRGGDEQVRAGEREHDRDRTNAIAADRAGAAGEQPHAGGGGEHVDRDEARAARADKASTLEQPGAERREQDRAERRERERAARARERVGAEPSSASAPASLTAPAT